jgi:hypothetical protein
MGMLVRNNNYSVGNDPTTNSAYDQTGYNYNNSKVAGDEHE